MCSTLAGYILSALFAKRNSSMRTDWRLTINNSAHYQQFKGNCLIGFCSPQATIVQSHHVLMWVSAPERPLMSWATNDLPIDNVPGAPPPEDTPNEETIDPRKPDPTCTPDQTKTKIYKDQVGVEQVWGKAYGKATWLYNKHRKYTELWTPSHPSWSVHDFQHAQSFSQQTKLGIDQNLT